MQLWYRAEIPEKGKGPERNGSRPCLVEQGTGIEPAFTAWEAVVLPIYEPCIGREGIIADPEGKCNHFLSGGSPWLWQKRKKQAAFSENPNTF